MNLQNQRPVFVPREHWDEFEKLSKAALMDLTWDLLTTLTEGSIVEEFRKRRDIVLLYRSQAKENEKVTAAKAATSVPTPEKSV